MCGINGIVNPSLNEEQMLESINSMNSLISHRGPDSQDALYDSGLGLGHVRLSILDLSSGANQPMYSYSGRYVIVFNGEIYNFLELKKLIQKKNNINFLTSSDTEVLINLIDCYGVEEATKLIEGMFAFCVFDKKNNSLYLVRDRFGEKPLYYYCSNNQLYFSSELKPLSKNLKHHLSIDYESLNFFFKRSYLPSGYSIFNEINKVKPATILEFDLSSKSLISSKESLYWNYKQICLDNSVTSQNYINPNYQSTKDNLENLIEDKIEQTMISDVPLGAFLSGGYDSSCVVAMMQKNSIKKIQTFSIGFNDEVFNEAHHAQKISNHLGTDHTELYLSENDLLETIIKLPEVYSEPFADSSQIPTLLLSKLTKEKVTVSLSGDGGDEIFGGYGKYFLGGRVKKTLGIIPHSIRGNLVKNNFLNFVKPAARILLANSLSNFEQKYQKLNKIFDYKNDEDLFLKLTEFENNFIETDKKTYLDPEIWMSNNTYFKKAMISDAIDYLPGDILTKVDMAAMSVSLETRIPFLNHKIAEFASKIPVSFLNNHSSGKYILKDITHKYIPKELMDRPKKGFDIPLARYLRHELRDYSESLLDYGSQNFSNELNFDQIHTVWNNHQSNKVNNPNLLWNLITFFAWHENYVK